MSYFNYNGDQVATARFSFKVLVGDKELPEYTAKDDDGIYVEANLHLPCSYIIKDQDDEGSWQHYPVTPFTVRGVFHNTFPNPCFLKLSLDGQQVWMKPFPPGENQKFWVRGYKQNDEVHELLFSLPKITTQKSSALKSVDKEDLGTIRMDCLEAVYEGVYSTFAKKCTTFQIPGALNEDPILKQTSKKDDGNLGITSRQGRNIANFTKQNYRKQMVKYSLGKRHFGSLVVKYRPRHVLREIGIEDVNWKTDQHRNKRPENSGEDRNDTNEQSMEHNCDTDVNVRNSTELESNIKQETGNERGIEAEQESESTNICIEGIQNLHCNEPKKMYCYSPTVKIGSKMDFNSPSDFKTSKMDVNSPSDFKTSKMDVNSPSDFKMTNRTLNYDKINIKKENGADDNQQYRIIEVDDDVCILEEIDDDVVWMGDDSCCFMDVTPPEIPSIDLIAEED